MNPEADLSLWHVNLYSSELKLLLLLLTCGLRTWFVGWAFENLLGVKIPSKNALILRKKNAPKIPQHDAQIPLQKCGI
jgi:hypothetical protein